MNQTAIGSSRWISVLFGLAAVTLVGMIIAFPSQAFTASLSGLRIWWEFVFPALLPFFILSEIMLGLGIIHLIGVMLEPVMRLLFRLPGAGGWAVAMSFTVGFPAGAKAAADLRRQGAISRQEGDRLLALSHLCSPVFLSSVVAVGFWGHAELGLPLIIIHLASALLTGLVITRILLPGAELVHPEKQRTSSIPSVSGPSASGTAGVVSPADDPAGSQAQPVEPVAAESEPTIRRRPTPPLWRRMVDSMVKAQRQDGRALGKLLGEAVGSSVQSLLLIGGFMIVFSVLIQLLSVSGVTGWLQLMLQSLMTPLGMPPRLSEGAITALFEVHLGAYSITQSGSADVWAAAIISAIVAWGGLSVHAQVKSLIAGTDLRYVPFLTARILHAVLSVCVTFALWQPIRTWLFPGSVTQEVFHPLPGNASAGSYVAWPQWGNSFLMLGAFLLTAILLSLLLRIFLSKRLFHFGGN